jgi:NDP-sugar pyrophosphorylase family protein
MIERLLRQLLDAGVRRVTVITGPCGNLIEAHLLGLEDLPGDLELEWIREEEPRGNVGSLSELRRDGRAVILVFADLATNLDFSRLLEVHASRGAAVTLTSHTESYRVRLGELVVEGDRVIEYREKPEKRHLICSGIAVIEPPIVELVWRDRPMGISDLISEALAGGHEVVHWTHRSRWIDVNSPDDLSEANQQCGS